jgi:hypothetical protein
MDKNNHQERQQQLAEQLFCVGAAYNALVKGPRHNKNETNSPLLFNDIVQLIKGNSQAHIVERSPKLIKSINADVNLRKIYLQLIKQLTFAQSGLQVAASSGESLVERVTEQFSVKFKRDKTQPSQVYVILTINHPAEHHLTDTLAVHITNNEQVDCLYFPAIADGRSQLLMEDEDKQFKLLIDPNSALYLM